MPHREYDIDSDVDDEPEDIVTKPGDDFVGPAEDVSARGPRRSLLSLHGGGDQLPETPEARGERLGGGGK